MFFFKMIFLPLKWFEVVWVLLNVGHSEDSLEMTKTGLVTEFYIQASLKHRK